MPLFEGQEPCHLTWVGRSPAGPVPISRPSRHPDWTGRIKRKAIGSSLRRPRMEPEPHHHSRGITPSVPKRLRIHPRSGIIIIMTQPNPSYNCLENKNTKFGYIWQIRSANISLDGLIRHNSERCSQHLQVVLSSSSGFGTGDESGGGPLSSTSSPARSNGNAAHLQLSRCTTSPMQANSEDVQKLSEPKLKGILKKSSSAQDITAPTDGYVITSNHAGLAASATAGHSPQNLYNSSPSPNGSSCTVAPLASMASSISSSSSDDGAATSAS